MCTRPFLDSLSRGSPAIRMRFASPSKTSARLLSGRASSWCRGSSGSGRASAWVRMAGGPGHSDSQDRTQAVLPHRIALHRVFPRCLAPPRSTTRSREVRKFAAKKYPVPRLFYSVTFFISSFMLA